MVKIVNLMLCVYYHNKKKKKALERKVKNIREGT